jgi:RNA polymerase sigma-70 factor (ECF subfamily)
MLRSRHTRREEPLETPRQPDPVVGPLEDPGPEQQVLLAESVGLALLVVLEHLSPAERVAFVLHDTFGVPFDEIAPMVDRTPEATRQLASRARRRVRGAAPAPDANLSDQRAVVDAFTAAARDGDFERLVATLQPDVTLRADLGAEVRTVSGAEAVARQARMYARTTQPEVVHALLVNGAIGHLRLLDGEPAALLGFTVAGGRIAAIDILADTERLARIDFSFLD